MALIMSDLRTYWMETEALYAVFQDRIYRIVAPEEPYAGAYIVYARRGKGEVGSLDGDGDLGRTDLSVWVWANSALLADQHSDLLRQYCSGYRGAMGDSTCKRMALVDQIDDFDQVNAAGEPDLFGVRNDYVLWHSETAPSVGPNG